MHPVFHVSLLRKKVGDQAVGIEQPPPWELTSVQEPAEILTTRVFADRKELLIRWKGSTKTEASWENQSLVWEHYLNFIIP